MDKTILGVDNEIITLEEYDNLVDALLISIDDHPHNAFASCYVDITGAKLLRDALTEWLFEQLKKTEVQP